MREVAIRIVSCLLTHDRTMKISFTRSSILTAILIAALTIATPFAIWEFVQTGELYILSHRVREDLVARLYGPGRLRFVFQPTFASIIGIRDGVKDGRAGKTPF